MFGVDMGKISVLSSLFFFGLGSGAMFVLASPACSPNRALRRTFIILLHVKLPQKHDSLLPEQASVDRVGRIYALIGVDGHDSAAATEAVIQAAKVHGADAVLAESGSAHDARLDGDIKVRLLEDAGRVLRHDLGEGDKFRMACALSKMLVSTGSAEAGAQ